ncbi:SprT-like domain-containing protein [Mycena kentingensis (nom. inval.)]|nr:SprT-like domain-containing protein [Mycena kentingensis (nom. inval.)]
MAPGRDFPRPNFLFPMGNLGGRLPGRAPVKGDSPAPDSLEDADPFASSGDERGPSRLPGAWNDRPSSARTQTPTKGTGRTPVATPKRVGYTGTPPQPMKATPRAKLGTPSSSKKGSSSQDPINIDDSEPELDVPARRTPLSPALSRAKGKGKSPVKKRPPSVVSISSADEMPPPMKKTIEPEMEVVDISSGNDTDTDVVETSGPVRQLSRLSIQDNSPARRRVPSVRDGSSSAGTLSMICDSESETRHANSSSGTRSMRSDSGGEVDELPAPPKVIIRPHPRVAADTENLNLEYDSNEPPSATESWVPSDATADDPLGRDRFLHYWTLAGRKARELSTAMQRRSVHDQERQRTIVRNQLSDIADQVYTYFNRKVFKNKLPDIDTVRLVWNPRLVATAGKAHLEHDGDQWIATIFLSLKILDSGYRVRLTLAHEMCHLAAWLIDGTVSSAHGPNFWKWAHRITHLNNETRITLYHEYKVDYLWTWRCTCGHIVGRWTAALKIRTAVCPKCRAVGSLAVESTPHPADHRLLANVSSSQAKAKATLPKLADASKSEGTPTRLATPSAPPTPSKSRSAPTVPSADGEYHYDEAHEREMILDAYDRDFIEVEARKQPESDSDLVTVKNNSQKKKVKVIVVDDEKKRRKEHSISELAEKFGEFSITATGCRACADGSKRKGNTQGQKQGRKKKAKEGGDGNVGPSKSK